MIVRVSMVMVMTVIAFVVMMAIVLATAGVFLYGQFRNTLDAQISDGLRLQVADSRIGKKLVNNTRFPKANSYHRCRVYSRSQVNEFYKMGCQEKKLHLGSRPVDRVRDFYVQSHPKTTMPTPGIAAQGERYWADAPIPSW